MTDEQKRIIALSEKRADHLRLEAIKELSHAIAKLKGLRNRLADPNLPVRLQEEHIPLPTYQIKAARAVEAAEQVAKLHAYMFAETPCEECVTS